MREVFPGQYHTNRLSIEECFFLCSGGAISVWQVFLTIKACNKINGKRYHKSIHEESEQPVDHGYFS